MIKISLACILGVTTGLGYDALIPGRGVLGVSVFNPSSAKYQVVFMIAF